MGDSSWVQHTFLLVLRHAEDVGITKGHAAGHHHVKYHPQAPHVVLLGAVGDGHQQLWGHVGCCFTERGAQI